MNDTISAADITQKATMAQVLHKAATILVSVERVYDHSWTSEVCLDDQRERAALPSGRGEDVFELYSEWCHSLAALFEAMVRTKRVVRPEWVRGAYAMIGQCHTVVRRMKDELGVQHANDWLMHGEWRLRQILASGKVG